MDGWHRMGRGDSTRVCRQQGRQGKKGGTRGMVGKATRIGGPSVDIEVNIDAQKECQHNM